MEDICVTHPTFFSYQVKIHDPEHSTIVFLHKQGEFYAKELRAKIQIHHELAFQVTV